MEAASSPSVSGSGEMLQNVKLHDLHTWFTSLHAQFTTTTCLICFYTVDVYCMTVRGCK